jgi:eukaryotic-like serine/threonine-protein kinase
LRLGPGVRVGTYEIIGVLGAGAMGEVYRARDTKLKRDVAIKALPEEFARDAGRIARFQREAEVLASLNHANIAGIYELAESGESRFLILELVEGETLAERVARGPMPLDEVLPIAIQVCEAIEAAHEKNIIHRDLKPANIKLTPGGTVKLLDFGLALIFEAEPREVSRVSISPTRMTIGGVVLGTAAYMSPEQARGTAVDKRTDIWAFGCVLFEMLTGCQAFVGETVSDIIAAILSRSPDMSALPKVTPRPIHDVIRRCVEKDPRLRLHDIADARIQISETVNAPKEPIHIHRAPKKRTAVLVVLGVLLSLLTFIIGMRLENSRDEPPSWSGSLLVGGSTIAWGPRVSPDGRTVAFIVMVDAQTQVALMDAESGSWDVLTKRPESGVRLHASWSRDGSKLYFTRGSTAGVNVYSIPAVGGEERLVLDNAYFPEPLPDGSLLITRSERGGQPQLYRFWPDDGRMEALPVFLTKGLDPLVPVRAFADGKEAVFFGRTMTPQGLDAQPDLHAIDLSSKAMRKLASNLGVNADLWPVSVDAGHSVLSDSPSGDLHRVVAIDRGDGVSSKLLFTLTGRFSGLDAAKDGTVFVDQQNNTLDVLKINPSGASVQRVARTETSFLRSHTVEVPDGRVIVPALVSGRPRLMLTKTNKLATSLIDTAEETSGPISVVGGENVAFLLGSGPAKSVAIASLTDRRLIRRIAVPNAASIVQLSASADGKTLYYVSTNTVFEVSSAGGEPRQIALANSFAVDSRHGEMILQRVGSDLSVRLFRMPLSGGSEEEIKINDSVRMGDVALAANAVGNDGKILVTTALDASTWYWQVSVFDPKTGDAKHIPTDFAGDILYAGWTTDGQILAMGVNTEGSIWRFRPQTK